MDKGADLREAGGEGNLAAGLHSGRTINPGGLGPGREFDLIRRFLDTPASPRHERVIAGPGDDAAVLDNGTVLSCDLTVEGIHYRREWLAAPEVGYRAATSALSDLAAMGAEPTGILVSLAVAAADAGDYAVAVMSGVREAVAAVGGVVLGGDLTASPGPTAIDVVAVGRSAGPIYRNGAKPGDSLWVTGTLGSAGLTVRRLLAGDEVDPVALERFVRPVARTREGIWLARRELPSAMLDISDGLAGDAAHLARASGVKITLDLPPAIRGPGLEDFDIEEWHELILSGGEDYELLFSAPPGRVETEMEAYQADFGRSLIEVGAVSGGKGVRIRTREGVKRLDGRGFQHFDSAR